MIHPLKRHRPCEGVDEFSIGTGAGLAGSKTITADKIFAGSVGGLAVQPVSKRGLLLGYRKFLFAIAALAAITWLRAINMIDAPTYSTMFLSIAAAFFGTNYLSKRAAS